MIMRLWRGWTTVDNAPRYAAHVARQRPTIAANRGYRGLTLLQRDAGDEVEDRPRPVLRPAAEQACPEGTVLPAAGDGEPSEKEEVIYVTLDASGELVSAYAVNSFPGGEITDYGDYDSVRVLNTGDEIEYKDGVVNITTDAKRIYRQSRHIPPSDKNLLLLRSDRHGAPPLLANHAAPTAPVFGPQYPKEEDSDWLLDRVEKRLEVQQAEGRYTGHDPLVIDALDWYGTWKLFDGLTDAAFYNRNRQYALGATPEQTGMGQWSDGTPVKPIKVLK